MTTRINLYRPKGFSDSSKFALNPSTGELLDWSWKLDPEDFSLDQTGDIFHNCNDKQSWSRIVRHGQKANNFFETEEKQVTKNHSGARKKITRRHNNLNISYKGNIQLRKRKYRNKKYKNRRGRKCREKNKKPIAFHNTVHLGTETCKFCRVSSEHDNIFNEPRERHCCDFCKKHFNGVLLHGKVCHYCLSLVFKKKFCEDCTKNLGEWDANWRMTFEIPQNLHPPRCSCTNCLQYPCFDCGMECHTVQTCPWGRYTEEANNQDDRIQEEVHDDYMWGQDY